LLFNANSAIFQLYHGENVNFQEITSAIFQLYHGENKLIFNEMMTRLALCSSRPTCSGFL